MTLEASIRAGDLAAAVDLLRSGVSVDRRGPEGLTPLMIASGLGRSQMVGLLLTAGADVLAVEPRMGATALHKASLSGNPDVVGLLLDHGAFIDQQSPILGHTALMDAVVYKHEDAVRLLLKRGAGTAIRNYWQETALDLARRDGLDAIARLIEAKDAADAAEVRAQALVPATKAGDPAEVERLIAGGAPVDAPLPMVGSPDDDYTPLAIAAREGHAGIVRALLEAGADPRRVIGLFGGTALHEAAYFGHADVVRAMTEKRGRVGTRASELDAQGAYNGMTPLHDAAWHGHLEAARALVDAGARLDLTTHAGLTPRELAVLYGYDALASLLAEAERRRSDLQRSAEDKPSRGDKRITQEHVRLVEQVAALQTTHEIDKLVAIFADDVVVEDVALGTVARGHAEVREMFEKIYASLPDYATSLVSAVADEDRGGAEWIMSETHLGDFPGLPASGRSFSLRAAATVQFADGRISRWTDYWSVSTFKEQAGLE